MRIVVLGGAGAMGQVAVRDLALSPQVKEVVIADVNAERAEAVKKQIASPCVSATFADIGNRDSLVKAFSGAAVVINSTPYKFNVQVMQAALAAGTNYIDLGGLFHTTCKQLELDEEFRRARLLAVLGMGAAPGMTNVMAAYASDGLDAVTSIDIVVAGVDFSRGTHPFLPPYALDTILDEYALEPWVVENGKLQPKPPMSGEVTMDMPDPIGRVKCFLTLHSEIATLHSSFRDKGVQRVTYRLGLPEEFHEKAKFLVELGFGATEPLLIDNTPVQVRKVLSALINSHPVPAVEPDDCEAVVVDVAGSRAGRSVIVRMQSVVHSHPEWKISCGALDTGVPPSIVAQMIASGTIKATGVLPPELCVPPEPFFHELAQRRIPMKRIIEEDLAQAAQKQPV